MALMIETALDRRVAAVRRFYTRQIGVLRAGYRDGPYSLTERDATTS